MSQSCLLLISICTLCLLILSTQASTIYRQRRAIEPELTEAVLEELLEEVREHASPAKRRVDAGYGGRYGAASSVAGKLMALKQAADWNGPGRKRRSSPPVEEDMQ